VALKINLYITTVNPSLCARSPASSTCVQNTTTGSANMALEQNQQAVWELQASDRVPLVCMS